MHVIQEVEEDCQSRSPPLKNSHEQIFSSNSPPKDTHLEDIYRAKYPSKKAGRSKPILRIDVDADRYLRGRSPLPEQEDDGELTPTPPKVNVLKKGLQKVKGMITKPQKAKKEKLE